MQYKEKVAVCSETYKCNVINIQNSWMLNLVVRKVTGRLWKDNLLKPAGHVMHQQFNIQQL